MIVANIPLARSAPMAHDDGYSSDGAICSKIAAISSA
jgi:hypothetical protein